MTYKAIVCLKKKILAEGFHLQKNSCTSSGRKKIIVQAENPPPPPPITFLMVRPLTDLVMWLATRAGRWVKFCAVIGYPSGQMERSCPLWITRCPFARHRKFNPRTMQSFLRFSCCSPGKRALNCSKNSQHLPKEKKSGMKSSWCSVNFVLATMIMRDQLKMASLPDSIRIVPHLRKSKFAYDFNNCLHPLSHCKTRFLI